MNKKFYLDYGSTFWFCRGTYLPKIWASCPPPPFRTLKLLLFRVVVFVFNKFLSFLQILNESVALFRNGSILLFYDSLHFMGIHLTCLNKIVMVSLSNMPWAQNWDIICKRKKILIVTKFQSCGFQANSQLGYYKPRNTKEVDSAPPPI